MCDCKTWPRTYSYLAIVEEPFEIANAYQAFFFKQAKKNIAAARLNVGRWACGLIIAVLFSEWAILTNMSYKDRVAVFP
jgi:hypothetical protein